MKNASDFEGEKVFFWSDSTTVLAWIQRDKPWKTFVYNRVTEIHKISDLKQWHYVPETMNPADLPSRGCKAQQLVKSRPAWLKLSREYWPPTMPQTTRKLIAKHENRHVAVETKWIIPW